MLYFSVVESTPGSLTLPYLFYKGVIGLDLKHPRSPMRDHQNLNNKNMQQLGVAFENLSSRYCFKIYSHSMLDSMH